MISVGYAGYEAFDLIVYIGRTLTKLNYRVLIVDLSATDALKNSIKHGLELDSKKDIINYRNLNYVRRIPSREELEVFCDGVVMVSYGNEIKGEWPIECQSINLVVNTFTHVISKVGQLVHDNSKSTDQFKLLIRDIISLDDVDRVTNELKMPVNKEKIDYLFLEPSDYESAVECQVMQVIRFTKVTSKVRKYIQKQIQEMFPKLTTRRIKKAIAAAKKGD